MRRFLRLLVNNADRDIAIPLTRTLSTDDIFNPGTTLTIELCDDDNSTELLDDDAITYLLDDAA